MNRVILYDVLDNDPKFEKAVQGDLKDLFGFQDYRIIAGKSEKEKYTIFAFLQEWEVVPFTKILKKYGMFLGEKDVTDDVIMGKIPGSCYQESFEFVTYRKILNDFIESNTTSDHVLDMISESGIDSLNQFQRNILKNY
jgi:hypothetical protein